MQLEIKLQEICLFGELTVFVFIFSLWIKLFSLQVYFFWQQAQDKLLYFKNNKNFFLEVRRKGFALKWSRSSRPSAQKN